jgi:hypothetical protein
MAAMKIAKPQSDPEFDVQAAAEMEFLLRQPLVTQQRPCPGCEEPCPCSASIICACGCSVKCPLASRQMSSDPEEHPVEQGIAPLVFALYGLRVVEPCWSCEGHMGPGDKLLRPPSVWFYSRSATYPMLIADYLAELAAAKDTEQRWHLCMVAFGDGNDVCPVFSIEPNLSAAAEPDLMMLRRDVRVIAEGFEAGIRALASAGGPCRDTGQRAAGAKG